jgi:hypothetical protein
VGRKWTAIEVTFEPVEEGTLVRLEQTGFERVPDAEKYLPGYDAGWKEVLGWFAERVDAPRPGLARPQTYK